MYTLLSVRTNCTLSALLCSAVVAASLGAQTPAAKRGTEKPKSVDDSKAKMSEQPTPATKQPPQDPKENTPPLQPSPPSSDGPVVAKREVAQKTLEALRSAIQSISRSGIDTARIKTQLQGLQDQLTESTDDSDIDELTAKAAGLLAEITKHRPKPPSRSNTFVIKDPKPEASPEPASAGGNTSLLLSSFAFVFSIVAVIVGPILCQSQARAAITKALKSAGLI